MARETGRPRKRVPLQDKPLKQGDPHPHINQQGCMIPGLTFDCPVIHLPVYKIKGTTISKSRGTLRRVTYYIRPPPKIRDTTKTATYQGVASTPPSFLRVSSWLIHHMLRIHRHERLEQKKQALVQPQRGKALYVSPKFLTAIRNSVIHLGKLPGNIHRAIGSSGPMFNLLSK